jgi:hypothetical protein
MIFRHHNKLERKSDTAIFFGCGPSINDITEDDYEVMKQYDKWAVNFFIYHDFIIPDFYYRGCGKSGKKDEFFHVFEDIWNKKKKGPYENTKFLADLRSKECISTLNTDEVFLIHLYRSWRSALKLVKHLRGQRSFDEFEMLILEKALEMFKIMKNKVHFYGRATLCFLLVLMYQMGYKEIILYGNDLDSKMYFWSDRDREEVHWQWTNQTKTTKAGKKEGHHPNNPSILIFVPWFNENYMNNRIFVGSKKTLLYDDVPYKSIEELK